MSDLPEFLLGKVSPPSQPVPDQGLRRLGRFSERVASDAPRVPTCGGDRMPALFAEVSRAWASLSDSPHADVVLQRWQRLEPSVIRCGTLDAVIEWGRGRGAPRQADDDVLRSLLRLAPTDDDARLAVLHVLAPGLTRLARGYTKRWGRNEAEAMVAAAALERIVAFGDRPSVRPSASIVLGVRHEVSQRALREDIRLRILGDRVPLHDGLPSSEDITAGEELLGLVDEGLRSGAITRRGARLIVLHRICGMSTQEVAAVEGKDARTVRKYRNRAEAALVDVAEAVA